MAATGYAPWMCAVAVRLGASGRSRTEIAAELGIARSTLSSWAERFPDFGCAVEYAQDLAQAWWEEKGREGLHKGDSFNAYTYVNIMRCRFPKDYGRRGAERLHKYSSTDAFLRTVRAISEGA
jgi:hypothetical protein